MTQAVLVANGEPTKDHSHLVDGADMVVRFNCTRHYAKGWTGSKTTVLALRGAGGPWVTSMAAGDKQVRLHDPVVAAAREYWFYDWPDLIGAYARTYTLECGRIRLMGRPPIKKARELLHSIGADGTPTLGLVTLYHVLSAFPEYELHGVGWRWNTGWEGHAWSAEEQLCRGFEAQGRITFHD
jgi:hypothetical protein